MKRAIVLAAALAVALALLASTASAMIGQMVGQAGLTGTLSNQTVQVSGWIMYKPDESNATVCVTIVQNGNKAYGCSTPIPYGTGQVTWQATLTGSNLVPGAANAHAVSTYSEGGKTKTWNWAVNNFTLVSG